MNPANKRAPIERLRMGPVKVIDVFTSAPPSQVTVTEALGNETVPFEQVRHLCSAKPLVRASRTDAAQ